MIRDQIFDHRRRHKALGQTLANLLGPRLTPPEIDFYTRQLLYAGVDHSLQQRLWAQIEGLAVPAPFEMAELTEIIRRCQAAGDAALALRLTHIRQVEQVIAPAGDLFAYLLSRDGQTMADVVKDVGRAWPGGLAHLDLPGFTEALDTIEDLDPDAQTRLVDLAEALQQGRFEVAITLTLAQNKAVMQTRGSQPWLLVKGGQLDVRLSEGDGWLSPKAELPDLWVNTYFINSLKAVGRQLKWATNHE